MKKNKFCSVISVMLATLMLLLCSGITVYSATPDCSVLLHYELSDVNFQLYRVGEITSDGVKAVKPFDAYQVDLYDEFAAYTLSGYVVKDKTAPTVETVTNDRGYATVDGLDEVRVSVVRIRVYTFGTPVSRQRLVRKCALL